MWKCVKRERDKHHSLFPFVSFFGNPPPRSVCHKGILLDMFICSVCCVSSLHFSSFVLLTNAEFIILNTRQDGSVCDFMYLAFVLNINFCDTGN